MRFLTFLSTFLISVSALAQQEYKGYYITKTGQKVDCYFKTENASIQDVIEYKISEKDEYTSFDSNNIKEYGVEGQFRFEKFHVLYDNSNIMSDRNFSKDPIWEVKEIFLSYLVEGDASLYYAKINGESRYFYSVASKNIEPVQLVYRKYNFKGQIRENSTYKQELFNNVRCEDDPASAVDVAYNRDGLEKVFTRFNACNNVAQKQYQNKGGDGFKLQFTVGAGAGLNILSFKKDGNSGNDTSTGFAVSGEAIGIIPGYTTGIYVRGEYTQVKGNIRISSDLSDRLLNEADINGGYVGLSVGPRFYLGKQRDKKGLFVDFGPGVVIGTGSVKVTGYSIVDGVPVETTTKSAEMPVNLILNAGIGYRITDKFGVDLRFETPREINEGSVKLMNAGLNLRYTF